MKKRNANTSTGSVKSTLTNDQESHVPAEKQKLISTRTDRIFFFYASLAGTFGALSAVVGKLAVMDDSGDALTAFTTTILSFFGVQEITHSHWVSVMPMLLLVTRGLLFAANAFFTAQMWRWYLKALSCGPTPVCQIVNTGMNFAISAFLGLLIFHEEVTIMWAIGALLVVVGLAVVVTDDLDKDSVQKQKS
ncbi:uncharacterized protein TM35_000221040 [Trypanosoma theileri]|uniref:EamA domain-containing protein n=1 Tax=Trypanosoma theileri TaxID=67003 RepID=A0A1X0NRG8_9TRYP|nr:uncharacterized protein TM35_000221040 [Trypanosoma theileri]ORC87305.1 hypothetical protein TM35_000221040 [Trypanosoma theileri]